VHALGRQRVAIWNVRVRDCDARRPARAPGAAERGQELVAPRRRALVERALVGEPARERGDERRAAAPGARRAVAAARAKAAADDRIRGSVAASIAFGTSTPRWIGTPW
jgi:hypothetical protein